MLFHQLPDEVLRHLLFYLDPGDTLKSFQLLNRHAAQLAGEPLLWKYHCLNSFKIWDWSHGIEEMKRRPVNDFDWRGAYLKRARDNARVSELFEEILASKLNRWVKFEEICKMGYDIKEFLIDQCNVNESSESGLARRLVAHRIHVHLMEQRLIDMSVQILGSSYSGQLAQEHCSTKVASPVD